MKHAHDEKNGLRRRSAAMLRAQDWAKWILGGSMGVGAFVLYLRSMPWPPVGENSYRVASLVVVVALAGLWILNSHREIDLLWAWLHPKQYGPPESATNSLQIAGVALVLTGLFYATQHVFWFGVAFVVYSLFDLVISRYVVQVELDDLFKDSKLELEKRKSQAGYDVDLRGYKVLWDYYMNHWHQPRRIVIVVLAILGLLVAWHGTLVGSETTRILAYRIFLFALIVPEVIIFHWRQTRDEAINRCVREHRKYE